MTFTYDCKRVGTSCQIGKLQVTGKLGLMPSAGSLSVRTDLSLLYTLTELLPHLWYDSTSCDLSGMLVKVLWSEEDEISRKWVFALEEFIVYYQLPDRAPAIIPRHIWSMSKEVCPKSNRKVVSKNTASPGKESGGGGRGDRRLEGEVVFQQVQRVEISIPEREGGTQSSASV